VQVPTPEPGLVIRYSYLWHAEARDGKEEGSKDRRCVIILALDIGTADLFIAHDAVRRGLVVPRTE
jgi:hypothetical protein